ncbi:ribosome maturation factor RimM [Haliangium ochraceum]|uniref:Ribosome maturation factor RimM n=1 Tax=Haliangium ochraceum (strain DSM 14365 / JCM 11303 / SMP-2) TaxID=502025 RepID=D0LKH3_HALO1|nr:ribosome maturation factor RimM [Haliangium ochraceum]ACY15021.1 16S rRNA processing protein RimM [Haliangium ochraceum DSM 14365]
MARDSSEFLEIGYVARPHGIRGELRVVTHEPSSSTLLSVSRMAIADAVYEVASVRAVSGGGSADGAFLVRLRGLGDRNAAELLRGRPVGVARDELPLEDDEVFLADLVGCAVVLEDGTAYGVIAAIDAGPQDRLVIHDGEVERLLPLVSEFVLDVDLEAERVVVAPPEGLPESPRR